MKFIVVASPDKISLSMYTDFLVHHLGGGYKSGYKHFLMTDESIATYLDEFVKLGDKGLLRHFANRKIKDPSIAVPSIIQKNAQCIAWFSLYSTELLILKDDGLLAGFSEPWKVFVKKMGGGG